MTTNPQAATPASGLSEPLSPELEEFAGRLHAAKRDRVGIDLDTVTLPPTRDLGYVVQAEAPRLAGGSHRRLQDRLVQPRVAGKIRHRRALVRRRAAAGSGAERLDRETRAPFDQCRGRVRPSDLPARDTDYTIDEVRAVVDRVAGAIEVVGRHFEGGPSGEGMLGLVVADHGVCVSLVLGAAQPFGPETDLRDHAVTMRINGDVVGEGVGAMALGDPVNSLTWLVNKLSKAGRGMRQGEWVTTGTCSGIVAVAPGDRAVADFGDLSSVDVTFAQE